MHKGRCYGFKDGLTNFTHALSTCEADGGTLFLPEVLEDLQAIEDLYTAVGTLGIIKYKELFSYV